MVQSVSYPSPVYRYDPIAQIMITERRNTSNGSLISQAPSAALVKEADVAAMAVSPNPSLRVVPQASSQPTQSASSQAATNGGDQSGVEKLRPPKAATAAMTDNMLAGPQANDLHVTSPTTISFLA